MLRSWGEWDKNNQGGVQKKRVKFDAQQRNHMAQRVRRNKQMPDDILDHVTPDY